MYIVPIAWLYVAMMMAVAEATSSTGSVLGAIITFLLYGLMPVALVMYLMGSPARKRAIKAREAREALERQASASIQPDAGTHAPTAAQSEVIPPVRKEP